MLEKLGAMLVQCGEIDAWRRLKREERVREDANEIRVALNYYTSNLNFDPGAFLLTGSLEECSRLIREDVGRIYWSSSRYQNSSLVSR